MRTKPHSEVTRHHVPTVFVSGQVRFLLAPPPSAFPTARRAFVGVSWAISVLSKDGQPWAQTILKIIFSRVALLLNKLLLETLRSS